MRADKQWNGCRRGAGIARLVEDAGIDAFSMSLRTPTPTTRASPKPAHQSVRRDQAFSLAPALALPTDRLVPIRGGLETSAGLAVSEGLLDCRDSPHVWSGDCSGDFQLGQLVVIEA